MPPPPAQITTQPRSSSQRIWRCSKMRFGAGDGTTRRMLVAVGLEGPAALGARAASASSAV